MTDTKKPGGRDISELKQRLGLRKAAPTVQPGSPPGPTAAPSAGLVAPPGLAPPQPPRPTIPNAQEDPFGAMNAIAAQGAVHRAPEIVIVNDGSPVENVGANSHLSTILKIAVPSLVALIIGVAIGTGGARAGSYNEGLKGARSILGDKTTPASVMFLKKQLSDLDTALDEAKTQKQFKPDLALDKMLKDAALKLEVKSDLVFRAKQNSLDSEIAGQILWFYAGIAEVKEMIDQHNQAALGDDMSLKKPKDAAADTATGGGPLKYGVLIQAPTEGEPSAFGAKIVLLASVYCGGANSPIGKCPEGESPKAFYQNDPGSQPVKADYVTTGSDNVPANKLIPLLPNGIRDSLIKGSEPTVSEVYYTRRMRAIYERIHGKVDKNGKLIGGLLEEGNKLQTRLQAEANKSPRFSFFM